MTAYIERIQSQREQDIVASAMQEFSELQTWRSTFAMMWEETAELIAPNYRNTFYFGNSNWPGEKKTQRQIDASGMLALWRFGAILDSLLTPRNMQWHGLEADNDYVMKDRATRLWFSAVTKILFKQRYKPTANFSSQNQQNYQSLGAFGTGNLLIDSYLGMGGGKGLRYKALPLGEMFLRENHQGQIDGFIRWFRLTARQAVQKWPKTCPAKIRAAAESSNSEAPFEFLHRCGANRDYDDKAYDFRGKLWKSEYISLSCKALLAEGGYYTFPVASSRYDQGTGEVYGRGPATMVLPALKTLNAQKTVFLKQGHRAGDPVLLGTDDGLVNPDFRPGAFNKGGMSAEGKPLIGTLPAGDINITKEMMDEERGIVDSAFLVDLFKILLGDPKIFTATQIMEMVSQRGVLIAPTVGRQQSEYLGPMIDRELDVAQQLGLLPPMPPRLLEAKGEYHVNYTSPLSREMRAQEAAGLSRTFETILPIINITQDPSPLDYIDMDKAMPDLLRINAVQEEWVADDGAVQQKRANRAKAAQQQQAIQAAPAAAALAKAKNDQQQQQPGPV